MTEAHKPHSGLTSEEIEDRANLVARWMTPNQGWQGSTEACEMMATYARYLEEQLETLRNLNDHVIRERDERERGLERFGEQLEAAQRKVDAYDRARSQVKIEGNTRAEYVLRIEALEEQLKAAQYEATRERETAMAHEFDLGQLREWSERALADLNKQLDAAPPNLLPFMQSLGELVASYPASEPKGDA